MKANLLIDNKDGMLKGWANIDPCGDNKDGRNVGPLDNLDWAFDKGELEELLVDNILNKFRFPHLHIVLSNWSSKLAIGGKITIRDVDFEEVARLLLLEKITLQQACVLLWGEQSKDSTVKQCGLSTLEMVKLLEKLGLKITKKIIDGYDFVIEAIRTS
jgi:sporulation protein YlmC with PRC-barrel domain